MTEINVKYREMCMELEMHNRAYHIDNQPFITDAEYDAAYARLKKFEQLHPELVNASSPTQYVGARESSFDKIPHSSPMLSLENVYNASEILKWVSDLPPTDDGENPAIRFEPKFDGASIELIYKDGKFVQAITRGDGLVGDDVTENVRTIKDVPKILHFDDFYETYLHVRGEIFMDFPTFDKINKALELQSLPLMRNPRNAAAGALRLKDTKEVALRELRCMVYEVMSTNMSILNTEDTGFNIENLGRMGFTVPDMTDDMEIVSLSEIEDTLEEWTNRRNVFYNFPIDGIVIKVIDKEVRDSLGDGTKAPKWARAFKFPAQQLETKLLNVEFSMGKTGAITPVAVLEPVMIDGTKIERASMHNFEFMESLGVQIGSIVLIEKAAEIIPQIVKVISNPAGSKKVKVPTVCPFCSGSLSKKKTKTTDESKAIYCTNPACEGKALKYLEYFVGRDTMNIDSVGPSTLALMFHNPTFPVKVPSDLYLLKEEHLKNIEGIGAASVFNILKSIENSKTPTFPAFIHSLAIPGVGKESSKLLADMFGDPEQLEAFLDSPVVGRKIILKGKNIDTSEILTFFSSLETAAEIRRLLCHIIPQVPKKVESAITGMTCVVTGTFMNERSELEARIVENGGKVSGAVSKNTDYLVQGQGGGSKADKAKALIEKGAKIQIISETDLLKLLN